MRLMVNLWESAALQRYWGFLTVLYCGLIVACHYTCDYIVYGLYGNMPLCPHDPIGTTVLKKHQPELVQLINLPELVLYLNRHEVLTDRENEILRNSMVPHHDRVLSLLSFVEKKGPDGYEKFLQALKEETFHMGHREVVKILTASIQTSSSSSSEIGNTQISHGISECNTPVIWKTFSSMHWMIC